MGRNSCEIEVWSEQLWRGCDAETDGVVVLLDGWVRALACDRCADMLILCLKKENRHE